MLYDLNIQWTPATSPDELQKTLKFAKSLGYDVVALNHIVTPPIPKIITNQIPFIEPPPTNLSSSSSPSVANLSKTPTAPLPTILRRVTITVTDPVATNHRLSEFARAHDILAVRPTTSEAFQWACLNADAASLISLDLSVPLGYNISPRTAMAAVQRGAHLEICYGQAVQPRGDGPRARSTFIGNTMALLRATRGRGLVASSEARSALGLRGPADVVNLLAVWGLGPEKGTEALRGLPRSVVMNEGIKRRGFRGVVDIVKTAGLDPNRPGNGGSDQKGKGQKRKNGEGVEAGGPEGTGQVTLSKRAAKKLRIEAARAEKNNAMAGEMAKA